MRYLRIFLRSARLIFHLILGCILVPFLLQKKSSGKRYVDPAITSWWHGRLLSILNFQISCTGQVPTGPALFVSNHISWVDIPLLGHLGQAGFLSKDDVRSWPMIGWLASSTGTLFIKRGDGQTEAVNELIAQQLQSGAVLTLFPEGTTTDGRDVRAFFPRLFAAVVDTDIKICPISIRYHINGAYDSVAPFLGEQTLGENLLVLLGRKMNQVKVHFHEPFLHQGETRKALAEKARNAIVSSLNTWQPDQLTKGHL